MKEQQHPRGNSPVWWWLHSGAVALGLMAIGILIYVLYVTCQEHVSRSVEMSRDTQWRTHAPVEGAQAAAILQGLERAPSR